MGRSKFFYGCLLTVFLEGLLSVYVVGHNNVFNFIRANYLCEITHSYIGLNEIWSMSNFRGMLSSLPFVVPNANKIAAITYILCCIFAVWLWIKIYPALQKISGQAFELIASISTIILIYFSMHGYLYDYLLMIIPALWLYIWSTTNDTKYTMQQSIFRLFLAVLLFTLPFIFWTNNDLMLTETTRVGCALRFFFGNLTLLFCAIAALIIEFRQGKRKALT